MTVSHTAPRPVPATLNPEGPRSPDVRFDAREGMQGRTLYVPENGTAGFWLPAVERLGPLKGFGPALLSGTDFRAGGRTYSFLATSRAKVGDRFPFESHDGRVTFDVVIVRRDDPRARGID